MSIPTWNPLVPALTATDLDRSSDDRAFPPRLPDQPIFYSVLNERYATEIAQGWNTNDAMSANVDPVTRFRVRAGAHRLSGAGGGCHVSPGTLDPRR